VAFDPNDEDYQRLSLQFARSLDGGDAGSVVRAFASFGHRFAQDHDSLPQTDEDRAFHLVAQATMAIDYQLPFTEDDEQANRLIERGHRLLDEALALDPGCADALRMKRASEVAGFDAYFDFLHEVEKDVRDCCEERRKRALATDEGERAELGANLAMRPYLRWLAMEAEKALICGRNRQCLRICERALEADPQDMADVRFTAALAYAKLEDAAGLEALAARSATLGVPRRHEGADAWTLLARVSIAHSRHLPDEATRLMRTILDTYPHAAATLSLQHELPDGVFSRLAVPPYSEDELILATSEATVLFQEGRDRSDRGALGSWVADEAEELDPADVRMVRAYERGAGARQGHARPGSSDGGQA
jgi:hypothetical protein